VKAAEESNQCSCERVQWKSVAGSKLITLHSVCTGVPRCWCDKQLCKFICLLYQVEWALEVRQK